MTIDDFFAEYVRLRWPKAGESSTVDRGRRWLEFEKAIRDRFASLTPEEDQWLLNHLQDRQAGYFVVLVLARIKTIDKRFFLPLVRAGVYEVNPSFNRQFIEPAVKHFGLRRVKEALLEFIDKGSTFEQAGAINALYWTGITLQFPRNAPERTVKHVTAECRAAIEDVAAINHVIALRLLELFVTTESVDVQRSTIPRLGLDPREYPDSHKPLIPKAIALARGHSDDYIRHRVEVQLGNEKGLLALPQRHAN